MLELLVFFMVTRSLFSWEETNIYKRSTRADRDKPISNLK